MNSTAPIGQSFQRALDRLEAAMQARSSEERTQAEESYRQWEAEHEASLKHFEQWYASRTPEDTAETKPKHAPRKEPEHISEFRAEVKAAGVSEQALVTAIVKAVRSYYMLPNGDYHTKKVERCVQRQGIEETLEATLSLLRIQDINSVHDVWSLLEFKAKALSD